MAGPLFVPSIKYVITWGPNFIDGQLETSKKQSPPHMN